MKTLERKIKLSYIHGLRPVVLSELKKYNLPVVEEHDDAVYISYSHETVSVIKDLKSVARAYLVVQNPLYHPLYVSKHKSLLTSLVHEVLALDTFRTFKISCAGSDSPEIQSISTHLSESLALKESELADLKIHIIKLKETWELGIQLTARPLSLRPYKRTHMSGAMDPTIAYAVNSFCDLDAAYSYLNVFSGSGTLLIEAGHSFPNINTLVGFDVNKKHLSLSIGNIKEAGLMRRIQVKEADIFDQPDFGTFDAIVSDLPFGMSILKKEDLFELYTAFVRYCERFLGTSGKLVVYTSEHELFEKILSESSLVITHSLSLKFITNVDAYLKPKIFVCEFKKD